MKKRLPKLLDEVFVITPLLFPGIKLLKVQDEYRSYLTYYMGPVYIEIRGGRCGEPMFVYVYRTNEGYCEEQFERETAKAFSEEEARAVSEWIVHIIQKYKYLLARYSIEQIEGQLRLMDFFKSPFFWKTNSVMSEPMRDGGAVL